MQHEDSSENFSGTFFNLTPDHSQIVGQSKWLVTGAAGFIGSHLIESLLELKAEVVGFDNLSSGYLRNLDHVKTCVGSKAWSRWNWIQGDLLDDQALDESLQGVDFVLHHAAIGSVPKSMEDPLQTQVHNVLGFQRVLKKARECGVKKVIYASSSAVYGDNTHEPKREQDQGRPLSPYALSKWMNELDAELYSRVFGLETVGLRYFNVFGPRQDPNGAYAAVIPRFFQAMAHEKACVIYGDGQTTRDFCFVKNVVQANLLAACAELDPDGPRVFNIATGAPVSLNKLHEVMSETVLSKRPELELIPAAYQSFRAGDIPRSSADISSAMNYLGYRPSCSFKEGIDASIDWYLQ